MTESRRVVLLAFGIALLLVFAYLVRHALLLIYISVVFAVVLSPAVDRVHRLSVFGWRPSRGIALVGLILSVLAALAVLLAFGLPPLISDIEDLVRRAPEYLSRLQARLVDTPLDGHLNLENAGRVAASALGGAGKFLQNAAGAVVSFATIVILTAYLILDGRRVFHWAVALFPVGASDRLEAALLRAGRRMRGWLVGQAILMLVLGSASAAVFGILRIRYFYLLAVFAGVANIIPLLGPIVTVILAVLVAAIDSFGRVLGVLIFYLVYQQVENAFLTPRIMQSQVQLPATAVVVGLLIGSELAGVAGALVAVPTTVVVSVLIDEYLARPRRQEAEAPAGRTSC